jgi:hypothetical protein
MFDPSSLPATEAPRDCKACLIIAAVVVLPFVPVTMTTLASLPLIA